MKSFIIILITYLAVTTTSGLFLNNPVDMFGVRSNYNSLLSARQVGPGCPLCDSSVYSYCSNKMIHDACCCNTNRPFGGGGGGFGSFGGDNYSPYQCQYRDCSYLYANSCFEHNLITTCCCNDPYRR